MKPLSASQTDLHRRELIYGTREKSFHFFIFFFLLFLHKSFAMNVMMKALSMKWAFVIGKKIFQPLFANVFYANIHSQ